jgi:hypothetical protein
MLSDTRVMLTGPVIGLNPIEPIEACIHWSSRAMLRLDQFLLGQQAEAVRERQRIRGHEHHLQKGLQREKDQILLC